MLSKKVLSISGVVIILGFFLIPFRSGATTEILFEIADSYLTDDATWGRADSTAGTTIAQRFAYLDVFEHLLFNDPSTNVCNISLKLAQSGNPQDDVLLDVYFEGWSPTIPGAGVHIAHASKKGSDLPLTDSSYTPFKLDHCFKPPTGGFYWFVWSRSDSGGQGEYLTKYTPVNYTYWTDYYSFDATQNQWLVSDFREWSLRLEGPDAVVAKEPVLIIPGIAGTELTNGSDLIWPNLPRMLSDVGDQFITDNLSLDEDGNSIKDITANKVIEKIPDLPIVGGPFFNVDTFKTLRENLESGGYVLNQDLFYFPYDWRLDLDATKDLLNQRINEIKTQTGAAKVNIIAHSLGGLLAKDYISQYGKDSINKLILVGVPHLGAPKAGKVLFDGDNFSIPWLEKDRIKDIARNTPTIYELLPQSKYFTRFQGYIKNGGPLLNDSETKSFLTSIGLNSNLITKAENFFSKNLQDIDLSGVDAYNIVGCGVATQAGYNLSSNQIKQIGYTSGDETVPLISARYINIPDNKKFYVKQGNHSRLPSDLAVVSPIVKILSGINVDNDSSFSTVPSFCDFHGKQLTWRSPVEVHIYDGGGRHTGPIENNAIEYGIPGVDYEIINGEKFIFLPADEGQTYGVVAKGLETGKFDLLIGDNDNGTVLGTSVFNDVQITSSSLATFTVSATTADNSIQFDYAGTGNIQVLSADAVLDQTQTEDVTAPKTQALVSGTTGENDWYKSDVAVTLVASDDNVGVLKTMYSTDGGATFNKYIAPISVTREDINSFQYYSVDKAGNNEPMQTLVIKIDKTAPEFRLSFDLVRKIFVFSSDDNLICLAKSCTAKDLAGNISILQFKQSGKTDPYKLSLKSVSYNYVTTNFDDTDFSVLLTLKGKVIKSIKQTLSIADQEVARINYVSSTNKSTISKLVNGKMVKEVTSGLKLLQVLTDRGKIKSI